MQGIKTEKKHQAHNEKDSSHKTKQNLPKVFKQSTNAIWMDANPTNELIVLL